jgi:transaldolase
MPEKMLKAFAEHGEVNGALPLDGGDSNAVIAQFAALGVEVESLAAKLQYDGAASFVASWNELMAVIDSKSAALQKAASTK